MTGSKHTMTGLATPQTVDASSAGTTTNKLTRTRGNPMNLISIGALCGIIALVLVLVYIL